MPLTAYRLLLALLSRDAKYCVSTPANLACLVPCLLLIVYCLSLSTLAINTLCDSTNLVISRAI